MVKELWKKNEERIFNVALIVFLCGSFITAILSIFIKSISNEIKGELNSYIIIAGIGIIYRYLKGIGEAKSGKTVEKVLLFKSSTPNHSEIENRLYKYKNEVTIYILANTLSTMWNTLLKHYLTLVVNGDLNTKAKLKIIKRVDPQYVDEPEKDPNISAIVKWFESIEKNKEKIQIEISVIAFQTYFTGICLNEDYMRSRMINESSTREIIRIAIRNNGDEDDATIEWFHYVYSDLEKRFPPKIKLNNTWKIVK